MCPNTREKKWHRIQKQPHLNSLHSTLDCYHAEMVTRSEDAPGSSCSFARNFSLGWEELWARPCRLPADQAASPSRYIHPPCAASGSPHLSSIRISYPYCNTYSINSLFKNVRFGAADIIGAAGRIRCTTTNRASRTVHQERLRVWWVCLYTSTPCPFSNLRQHRDWTLTTLRAHRRRCGHSCGTFPSPEPSEEVDFYTAQDLRVGETLTVLGRRFLLYDCDDYTRNYYRDTLGLEQPARIHFPEEQRKPVLQSLPPHIGIGAPEDTLQSCFTLALRTPKKNLAQYNLNANKCLRYLCELDPTTAADVGRRFVLSYCPADSTVRVDELARRNSGLRAGAFLARALLQTPESDPDFPSYYTPDRFYIGAVIPVHKQRLKIVGCDLFVYHYMLGYPTLFPPHVVHGVREYLVREGYLEPESVEKPAADEKQEKGERMQPIGAEDPAIPSTSAEQCLATLETGEGSAPQPRPHTPPSPRDNMSYEERLRFLKMSAPASDDARPLKGILKSGEAREDHQKVVCFNAPAPSERRSDDGGLSCEQYEERSSQFKEMERAERRARISTSPPEVSHQNQLSAVSEEADEAEALTTSPH